ncbi:MAG: 4Fe-4S binding protein [Chlorobiaceae bacterium]|nr:4Fe-4S binding protein [Chlorobiaceae bacterium]
MKRQIITIDEKKCTGCGDCIPACPEGALQVIDGKARLISDLFCDGLGACIGHCPTGAMKVVTREAEPYDEKRVMHESITKAGPNVIAAHLRHLADHGQEQYLREALEYLEEQGMPNPLEEMVPVGAAAEPHRAHASHGHQHAHAGGGCPGSRMMDFSTNGKNASQAEQSVAVPAHSALRQWPVQLHLVSPIAPYFQGSDLLLAADCTAFAVGNFHGAFMKGKSLAIACPKLDSNMEVYVEKLTAMIDMAKINTITVAIMEVPCCWGLVSMVTEALGKASRKVPVKKVVVGVQGDILSEEWI